MRHWDGGEGTGRLRFTSIYCRRKRADTWHATPPGADVKDVDVLGRVRVFL